MKSSSTLIVPLLVALVVVAKASELPNNDEIFEPQEGMTIGLKSLEEDDDLLVAPKFFDFGKFKSAFKKQYSGLLEELARKRLFLCRAWEAFLSYVGYKHFKSSSYLGMNEFSDWTEEEISEMYNSLMSNEYQVFEDDEASDFVVDLKNIGLDSKELLNVKPISNDSVVDREDDEGNFLVDLKTAASSGWRREVVSDETIVDHRQSGCLTPVKSQKRCGSCYIFATMALYEFQYCKETGNLLAFSEQYPIDCGSRAGLNECKGGLVRDVALFNAQFGVELAENYPYRRRFDTCPYAPDLDPNKMGHIRVAAAGMVAVPLYSLDKTLKLVPLVVNMGVPSNFHAYGGGVDFAISCSPSRIHSMLMVGSGKEDGVDYWLIRNSYGLSRGQKGYYKLAKRASSCFPEDRVYTFKLAPGQRAFGPINEHNDGSTVREHYERNKRKFSNLFFDLFQ